MSSLDDVAWLNASCVALQRIAAEVAEINNGASPRSPLAQRTPSAVLFSPYNMVKLIPAKEHTEQYRAIAKTTEGSRAEMGDDYNRHKFLGPWTHPMDQSSRNSCT